MITNVLYHTGGANDVIQNNCRDQTKSCATSIVNLTLTEQRSKIMHISYRFSYLDLIRTSLPEEGI